MLLLVDDKTHGTFVGTGQGAHAARTGGRHVLGGLITAASNGYKVLTGARSSRSTRSSTGFRVPLPGGSAIQTQGVTTPSSCTPTSTTTRGRHRSSHRLRRRLPRQREGSFARRNGGQELEPGWKTYNGFKQFSKIVTDPLLPQAVPARSSPGRSSTRSLAVLFSFALGLFLAITLDKKEFRGQRFYRSLLQSSSRTRCPSFLHRSWSGPGC